MSLEFRSHPYFIWINLVLGRNGFVFVIREDKG